MAVGSDAARKAALGAYRLPATKAVTGEEGNGHDKGRTFLKRGAWVLSTQHDATRMVFTEFYLTSFLFLQLHESHDKLIFVCQGYIDRLSVDKLPPALQEQLKELKESPVPLYDRRLPWSQDLQSESRPPCSPPSKHKEQSPRINAVKICSALFCFLSKMQRPSKGRWSPVWHLRPATPISKPPLFSLLLLN